MARIEPLAAMTRDEIKVERERIKREIGLYQGAIETLRAEQRVLWARCQHLKKRNRTLRDGSIVADCPDCGCSA